MDKMSMAYFSGVAFVGGGYMPDCRALFTRRFKDYYGIQYSQDGEFMVELEGAFKRTLSGAWVLVTRPGPLFRYGAPPGGRRLHAFVCFKGPRIREYLKSGLLPDNPEEPLVRITRPERFLETLRQLVVLINPLTAVNYPRAVHKLEDLLLQLHEQPAEAAAFPEYWRAKIMNLGARINKEPGQAWDFRAAARALNISCPHFRRLFRQHGSLSPGQFLIRARLRLAAGLLITTALPVKVLAAQSGFADSFYFSRLFRKNYGRSPSDYRAEFGRL